MGVSEVNHNMQNSKDGSWGRKTAASLKSTIGITGLVVGSPLWVTIIWAALEHFNGSLGATFQTMITELCMGRVQSLLELLPKPSWTGALLYIGWVLFQALLFQFMPGRFSYGQQTPGGQLLKYNTNGLICWALTHLLFFFAVSQGWTTASVIARHWQGLFVAANVYGYVLAGLLTIKAHFAPTYPEDCKFSGSWIHDLWMGIELNPRVFGDFDLKLFHQGRPGIVAWTLIDVSFAAYQYELHGFVSNSMLIVITLHSLYVLDFFANEDWYLRTIDMSHDHFGMMLAWGDVVFLPTFYTLQTQYLARYPTILTSTQAIVILAMGLVGYIVFRAANEERNHVRQTDGDTMVWNRPAAFIRCKYTTSDGKEHQSLLLTSGWWGLCRHANYTADMLFSFATCAPCGTHGQLLPWSYFLWMCALLNHRTSRDEKRCSAKYGETWAEYCRIVPQRLIPGVY